jgi:hypothetical protein
MIQPDLGLVEGGRGGAPVLTEAQSGSKPVVYEKDLSALTAGSSKLPDAAKPEDGLVPARAGLDVADREPEMMNIGDGHGAPPVARPTMIDSVAGDADDGDSLWCDAR